MIVTRKHLSRRTLLRGIGAAIAMPFLDSMVPAFAGRQTFAKKWTANGCASNYRSRVLRCAISVTNWFLVDCSMKA